MSQESTVKDFQHVSHASTFTFSILSSCIKNYLCFERFKQFIVCRYFYAELLDSTSISAVILRIVVSAVISVSESILSSICIFHHFSVNLLKNQNFSHCHLSIILYHAYITIFLRKKTRNFICYFYHQSFDVTNLPLVIERKVHFSSHS